MLIFNKKLRYTIPVLTGALIIILISSIPKLESAVTRDSGRNSTTEALKWYGFNAGMALAAKEKKLILIDVFTDWCHWCEVMDKETYAKETVIDYINKNYVAIKLDAESEDKIRYKGKEVSMKEWSLNMGITGFPTTLFMESDGTPVTLLPGYAPPDLFSDILEYIVAYPSVKAIEKGEEFLEWQKKKETDTRKK